MNHTTKFVVSLLRLINHIDHSLNVSYFKMLGIARLTSRWWRIVVVWYVLLLMPSPSFTKLMHRYIVSAAWIAILVHASGGPVDKLGLSTPAKLFLWLSILSVVGLIYPTLTVCCGCWLAGTDEENEAPCCWLIYWNRRWRWSQERQRRGEAERRKIVSERRMIAAERRRRTTMGMEAELERQKQELRVCSSLNLSKYAVTWNSATEVPL
jgi:hypothetical protein